MSDKPASPAQPEAKNPKIPWYKNPWYKKLVTAVGTAIGQAKFGGES